MSAEKKSEPPSAKRFTLNIFQIKSWFFMPFFLHPTSTNLALKNGSLNFFTWIFVPPGRHLQNPAQSEHLHYDSFLP